MTEKKQSNPLDPIPILIFLVAAAVSCGVASSYLSRFQKADQKVIRRVWMTQTMVWVHWPDPKGKKQYELDLFEYEYPGQLKKVVFRLKLVIAGFFAPLFGLWGVIQYLKGKKFKARTLRGAELGGAGKLNRANKDQDRGHGDWQRLRVGKVKIPIRKEILHTLLVGSTGTGKSTLLYHWLATLRKRGQRAIILDPSGEFAQRFYREGDLILNPNDARFPGWSIFNEMRQASDADRLGKSVVPDVEGEGREWNHYAQDLVTGLLTSLYAKHEPSQGRFVELLTRAPKKDLERYLYGQPGQAMMDEGAEKMLGSVRAIIGTYARPFDRMEEGPFSIRNWVRDDGSSWLFIPFQDSELQSLKPLLAAWLDIAISEVLSLPSSEDRRVWFFLDEISAIGKVQGLMDLLTRARKQGGAAVVGLQSIAQFKATYGDKNAQSLQSCLTTNIILRCADAETAEAMSLQLGTREIVRINQSGDTKAPAQKSEQVTDSRLVMASELQTLKFLHGFIQISGPGPVVKIKVPFYKGPKDESAGSQPRIDTTERRGRRRSWEDSPC